MNIILIGNKKRGVLCLKKIINSKHNVLSVIGNRLTKDEDIFTIESKKLGFKVLRPDNINDPKFVAKIKKMEPDLIVIAGYSQILKQMLIKIPKHGCINLHGGKLPEYRGSSPMNWVLLNNKRTFTITIIKVNEGVDTGDILDQKTFAIKPKDTIVNLTQIADHYFPKMLINVIKKIETNSLIPKPQKEKKSSYFPLRFPEDGIIFFDSLNALEIHNKVRALTSPFPGAFSYYNNRKIKILKSSIPRTPVFGESGRIYRISEKRGLLVCARDKCIWLNEIVDFNTEKCCMSYFSRYEKLATIKFAVQKFYENS